MSSTDWPPWAVTSSETALQSLTLDVTNALPANRRPRTWLAPEVGAVTDVDRSPPERLRVGDG